MCPTFADGKQVVVVSPCWLLVTASRGAYATGLVFRQVLCHCLPDEKGHTALVFLRQLPQSCELLLSQSDSQNAFFDLLSGLQPLSFPWVHKYNVLLCNSAVKRKEHTS